ncbi:unnamed protein product, partial [marine sediment metagenome]
SPGVEIEINIRQVIPFWVEKSLEKKIMFERIVLRDIQKVSNNTS